MMQKIENAIPKLAYFVIITTIIVATFSFSKYESAMSATANVTVASFLVNATGSDIDNLSLDCNSDNPIVTYDVVVTNKSDNIVSQVSTKYDIVLEFNEALPTGLILTDGRTTINSVEGQKIYVFNDTGVFTSGVEASNLHTIAIVGSEEVLNSYNGTMTINVDATQID